MDIRPTQPVAGHHDLFVAAPPHGNDGSEHGNNQVENTLSPEEQRQVAELRSADRRVRAHEAAHVAAAGQYAHGGASFDYQRGPDGKRYAVGGEVGINASPVSGDPEATLRKMEQVRRAALAPADPSPQDRRVAAEAARHAATARQEMFTERSEARTIDAPAAGADPAGAAEPGVATTPAAATAQDQRDRAPQHGYDAHADDVRGHRDHTTPGLRLDRTA